MNTMAKIWRSALRQLRADRDSEERWANHYFRAWQESIDARTMTTSEVADLLGATRRQVQNYCKQSGVPKHGGNYQINLGDVEHMKAVFRRNR